VFGLLAKENCQIPIFPIPLTLAARRHLPLALQLVNLADAMCSFVRIVFPSLPASAFLGLPGLT
jgi:hypothetical protein